MLEKTKNNKEMKQTRPVPSVSKGVDMSKVKWTSEKQDDGDDCDDDDENLFHTFAFLWVNCCFECLMTAKI